MKLEDFNHVVERRMSLIRTVLIDKGREYARKASNGGGGDRLKNFKDSALIERVTPEASLLGKWGKHVTSIIDFIKDIDEGIFHDQPKWEEKIGDAINYLILLEALITERNGKTLESIEGRGD